MRNAAVETQHSQTFATSKIIPKKQLIVTYLEESEVFRYLLSDGLRK